MKNIILFVMLCVLAIDAHSRTWTSNDGRTLEAEFVATGPDYVVVATTSNPRLVIRFSQLKVEDVEFAKAQKVSDKIKTYPDPATLPPIAYIIVTPGQDAGFVNDNTTVQLYRKYLTLATMIKSDATEGFFRQKLGEDIAEWEKRLGEIKPPSSGSPNSAQGAYQKRLWAAQSYLKWLKHTVPAWLAQAK